jgi:hypothetical protein
MSAPTHQESDGPSRRNLTLTYYVEPKDMRRLTLPVTAVRVLLGFAAVSVLWTLGSLVYLGVGAAQWLQESPVAATASLEAAQRGVEATPAGDAAAQVATIAPGVQILPPSGSQDAPAAAADDDVGSAVLDDALPVAAELGELEAESPGDGPGDVELPSASPAVSEPTAAAPVAASELATPGAASEPVAPRPEAQGASAANPTAVTLEQQQLVDDGQRLEARVRVVNSGASGSVAAGQIWGVATFTTDSGETIEIESRLGHLSYKAKKLTVKDLTFPYPEGEQGARQGRFTSVKVLVTTDAAAAPSVATYPVTATVAR